MSTIPGEIRVLHVDDDDAFAELVATYLEREDDRIDVVTTTAVADAVAALDDDVDCVLADYDMPDRTGIEFLEVVQERYPDLPFVLFTGKGSEEIASEAISAGVTDYLQKGTGTEQYTLLANRIVNAVESYRSRRVLEERKRRLETLIDNLPGFVYRCENDPGWPMEYVEGDCEQLTGYTAAELESDDSLWGEEVLHPDDRDHAWDVVQSALADDGQFELTYRIVTQAGNIEWMWERGQAIYEGDELVALEGFVTSITDQKEHQRELERKNRRLDEFATIVSHDLRNPLAVASGHTEIAREECDSDHLDAVADAHDRMRRLIEGLLDLARDGETTVEPVALASAAEYCRQNVAASANSSSKPTASFAPTGADSANCSRTCFGTRSSTALDVPPVAPLPETAWSTAPRATGRRPVTAWNTAPRAVAQRPTTPQATSTPRPSPSGTSTAGSSSPTTAGESTPARGTCSRRATRRTGAGRVSGWPSSGESRKTTGGRSP
ncbi:response regulator [Halogeometricum sp. CBA1124]|nr:response regulator [Halogeometricum sp. CBA1124]